MDRDDPYFGVDVGGAAPRAAPPAKRKLQIFSASDFAGSEAPARFFHVDGLIPGNTVTILGGDGGVGKSILALQLGVATAADLGWCGHRVQPGGCIYLSAEDDVEELHRRLEAIAEHDQVRLEDLGALKIVPLAGEDALLMVPDKGNVLKATELLTIVTDAIATYAPALVILDTLADLYGGEENQRAQARQFIGMLRGWAIRHRCAVLLLAHPSLTGIASGSGSSGSTAWNNSVRSRLYLDRVKGDDGFESDPDARVLRTVKANYSRTGGEIRLRWQEGVFVTVDQPQATAFGAIAAQVKADQVFLGLLASFEAQGRHVSATTGANFAPHMFAKDPRAEGITKRGMHDAMSRLFAGNRIRVAEFGPPSRRLKKIVATPSEERAQ